MEAIIEAKPEGISLAEWLKKVYRRIADWFISQKSVFLASAMTSIVLDIVTGLVFGITGAAIFAAL
jgi:hypothetical protein